MVTAIESRDAERIEQTPIANSSAQSTSVLVSHLSTDLQKESVSLSMRKVERLGSTNDRLERIEALLQRESRTEEERIELFNLLLLEGKEKIVKAQGKDIVLFMGNTDAGKSTLINSAYGCTIVKNAGGQLIVDLQSPIKQVTKIGTTLDSCTALPEPIPELSIKFNDQEQTLTFFDMPGLHDTRGIEVALANAILAKKIISHAKTVRFVVVFERSLLSAKKGAAWKETVDLIEEKFSRTLGRGKNSLSLVISKNTSQTPLEQCQQEIKNHVNPKFPLDLSMYATTYDPLNPQDREQFLQTLFKLRAYKGLSNQISLSASELHHATRLGDNMAAGVTKDLESNRLENAVNKARFTYKVSTLGHPELTKPHETVSRAVYTHIKKILEDIDPIKDIDLKTRIEALKKYNLIKSKFQDFINFEDTDKEVRKLIHQLRDPRSWFESYPSIPPLIGTGITLACGIWIHPLAVVPTGLVTSYYGYKWIKPSQEERETADFFKRPDAVRA